MQEQRVIVERPEDRRKREALEPLQAAEPDLRRAVAQAERALFTAISACGSLFPAPDADIHQHLSYRGPVESLARLAGELQVACAALATNLNEQLNILVPGPKIIHAGNLPDVAELAPGLPHIDEVEHVTWRDGKQVRTTTYRRHKRAEPEQPPAAEQANGTDQAPAPEVGND